METEYTLKKLLNASSLKLKSYKLLAAKETLLDFKNTFRNTKRLFTRDIKSGLFPMLGVPIDDDQVEHKVFLCQVAVGRCIYANRVYAENFPTPPEFDSYLVETRIESKIKEDDLKEKNLKEDKLKEKNLKEYDLKDDDLKEDNRLRDLKENPKDELNEDLEENDPKGFSEDDSIEFNEILKDNPNPSTYAPTNTPPRSIYDPLKLTNTSLRSILDPLTPLIKTLNLESPLAQYNSLIPETASIKNYSYLIKTPQRIFPIAEIDFFYDKKLDQSSKNKCDLCRKENSIMFCHAERASFCKKCDQQIHCNEFTMRHKRFYHEESGKREFMNCNFHSEIVVEFFCVDCKVPVCTQCRLVGNHAGSTHRLITYLDACDVLREKVKSMNEVRVVNFKNSLLNSSKTTPLNSSKNTPVGTAKNTPLGTPLRNSSKINSSNKPSLTTKTFKEFNTIDNESKSIVDRNIDELKSAMFKFKSNVEHVLNKIEFEYTKALRELRQISMNQCQLYNAEMLKNLKTKNEIVLLKNFLENIDDISIVRDFNLIESLKVVEYEGECCLKDVSLRLNGELSVVKVRGKKSKAEEKSHDVCMDAYIESKEK